MKKLFFAAAAAAALGTTQAGATNITITSWSIGANLIGAVSVGAPPVNHGAVYINQFHYVGYETGNPMNVFDELTNCIDLEHYVSTGAYTLPSLSTRISDLTQMSRMLAFIGHTTPLVAASTGQQKNIDAAAMQLGIWEILYEGVNANYDVTTGNFQSAYAGYVSAGDFAAAQSQANGWLANAQSGTWTPIAGKTLGYLYAPNVQAQVYLTDTVPEPSQWALLIAGFGLTGWAARRRARRLAAA